MIISHMSFKFYHEIFYRINSNVRKRLIQSEKNLWNLKISACDLAAKEILSSQGKSIFFYFIGEERIL